MTTRRRVRKPQGFSLLQATLIMLAVWVIFRYFIIAVASGFQG